MKENVNSSEKRTRQNEGPMTSRYEGKTRFSGTSYMVALDLEERGKEREREEVG